MHLSARQLRQYAADVDDFHHQQMRSFAEEAADLHLDGSRASRRRFLAGSGAVAGATAVGTMLLSHRVAALRPWTTRQLPATPRASSSPRSLRTTQQPRCCPHSPPGRRAVQVAPPGSCRRVRRRGRSQCGQRAQCRAADCTRADAQWHHRRGRALEFAFVLEGQAAYTYAAALTLLQDPAYSAATATILPIESQHQVVIGLALGKPVTDVFPTDAFESAALGDGTDPLAGLDPEAFPA